MNADNMSDDEAIGEGFRASMLTRQLQDKWSASDHV